MTDHCLAAGFDNTGADEQMEPRAAETEKWLAYYDALRAVECAQIDLLRQTGTILAAIREASR